MRAVVWSRRALLELTHAIDYLAQRNLAAAQRLVFLLAIPLFEAIDLAQAEGWLRVLAHLP